MFEEIGKFLGSDAFGGVSKLAGLGLDYQSMLDKKKFNKFNMNEINKYNEKEDRIQKSIDDGINNYYNSIEQPLGLSNLKLV
jgi:hypothetical protein